MASASVMPLPEIEPSGRGFFSPLLPEHSRNSRHGSPGRFGNLYQVARPGAPEPVFRTVKNRVEQRQLAPVPFRRPR